MNKLSSKWKDYWKNIDDAKHRYNTNDWKKFYSKELSLFFLDEKQPALELGCGNGELIIPYLSRFSDYIGTDFSLTMLRTYKKCAPSVKLFCADASNLPLKNEMFGYIFSNGVCQYMNEDMLIRNLESVHDLLKKGGFYFIGNIPDKQLRFLYNANALRADKSFSLYKMLKAEFFKYFRKYVQRKIDDIWYSRRFISELASSCGFSCKTFSSLSYEYRFHALLKKE